MGDKDGEDKEVIRLNRNRKYIRKKKGGEKGINKDQAVRDIESVMLYI